MTTVQSVMSEDDYARFSTHGYFTIRRTHHFWSGNFTDQTIEQDLMRMLKSAGGMTHGREITESTLTNWVYIHFPSLFQSAKASNDSQTLIARHQTSIVTSMQVMRARTSKTKRRSTCGYQRIHHSSTRASLLFVYQQA